MIERVGAGTAWQPGERVFGISSLDSGDSDSAGLQQYAVMEANAIGKIPDSFSDEQAVTLPVNLVTSWAVLFTDAGFDITPPITTRGDPATLSTSRSSVVIIGGGTNVGQLAVQLAHIAKISTIIVIAGPSNAARLKSMGATHVIDRHAPTDEITRQIHAAAGADGITQVYNCAQLQVDMAIAALASSKPSKLRLLLPMEEEEAQSLRHQRPLCDVAYMADITNKSLAPYTEQFWSDVQRWLQDGKILPTEYRVLNGLEKVEEINDALDAYRDFTRAGPQTVVKIG